MRKVNPRLEGGTIITKGGWALGRCSEEKTRKEDPNTLARHSLGKYKYEYSLNNNNMSFPTLFCSDIVNPSDPHVLMDVLDYFYITDYVN